MSFTHGTAPGSQLLSFRIGVLKARLLHVTVGTHAQIDARVQFIDPRRIRLGSNVEILRNTTLDGRSSSREGIVIGGASRIKENVWLACYGGVIHLGEECFVARNVTIEGHGGVSVGSHSSLGPHVVILSHRPPRHPTLRLHEQGFIPEPVAIGDDSHIGAGTVVMSGVTIGERVMVGANAVVTSDLESGWVYAGIPARRVGRFDSAVEEPGNSDRHHTDWEQR